MSNRIYAVFYTTHAVSWILLGYTKFCFICCFLYVFGRGMCLKNAIGTGLTNSGDIYKYSLPHICMYIYKYTK